ncbi:hypothetical protein [Paenibacillus sp. FSL W8-0194]|uniref:hypothetical protein n=1 Tax=Paenibacillus sp. FSL W8-0194 TaxID=2921711 RepID=UPI0030DA9204
MNRRGAGVAFLAIAAFLFAMKYMVVALLLKGPWSWEEYENTLGRAGAPLLLLSILFFIAGLIYFILGDFPTGVRRCMDRAIENWRKHQEANKVWEENLESDSEKDEKA